MEKYTSRSNTKKRGQTSLSKNKHKLQNEIKKITTKSEVQTIKQSDLKKK